MIFNKTCKIAIKAVSYLASQTDLYSHHSIKEIAEEVDESEHTLGKTLQLLVKSNIIHSVKGPSGGFYLGSEQLNLPLLNIIESIEGKYLFNKCVLGYEKCSSKNPCGLHNEFKIARVNVEKILINTKISDLIKKEVKQKFIH